MRPFDGVEGKWKQPGHTGRAPPELPTNGEDRHKRKEFHDGSVWLRPMWKGSESSMGLAGWAAGVCTEPKWMLM